MPTITVFSASSSSVDRKYFNAAAALGAAIAGRGWTLVYGGNNVGPMGALADGARAGGGRVIGITPRHFVDAGCADHACDELLIVENMRQRKAALEERADAFVALPGGLGTLEELIEIWVARQLGMHQKQIVLLNIDGFWDPLLELFRRGIEERFYRASTLEMVWLAASVDECMELLARNRE